MTEKMRGRLADLKARQDAGEHMLCPRCGKDTMKPDVQTNTLSLQADGIYVCDFCGDSEILLNHMKRDRPLILWAALRSLRPTNRFRSMSAADVLASIMQDQLNQLKQFFKQYAA